MKLLASLRTFLSSLFRRLRVEDEMEAELRVHIENRAEDLERSGVSRAEAERRARLEFGGYQKFKEECREAVGVHFFETLIQDLRYALRMLRKSPAFTTVAVLTLALGIGANTAIFSMVDGLVLRPLPVNQPDRIVFLMSTWKGGHVRTPFSYPDFMEIQRQTADVFADSSAFQSFQMAGLSVDGKSQPIWTSYVSGDFFEMLGLRPALGRLILPSEGKVAGADPVLVLSYSCWQSHFNRDPDIIGKKASVNGHPVTIVGVAPEGFHGLASLLDFQGYLPLSMAAVLKDAPDDFLSSRENPSFGLIARLKQNVSLNQAQTALQVVAQRLSQQYPKTDNWMSLRAMNLGPSSLAIDPGNPGILTVVSTLFLALAAAVLVLACLNIANLCLLRAAARQPELAMRATLGATRGRLLRQLLSESALLAALGCGAGIILGLAASTMFGYLPMHTALPIVLDFHFDWRVFAYALAAAVLTSLLVGIAPAFRVARSDLNELLREGGRSLAGGRQRLRRALVMAQVAGSLTLLIVAGLFVRSLEKVQHADLGFDPNHVFNLSMDPHEAGYDEAQARGFFKSLVVKARALPGVESASLAASVPMGYNDFGSTLKIDGYLPSPNEGSPRANYNVVSANYFQTMHIPLLRGRDIRDSDDPNSSFVAVINQGMADRYWHGLDPIGRRFFSNDLNHSLEIVGVVKNSLAGEIFFPPNDPFFYASLTQTYETIETLQVRAPAPPEATARELTGLVHSLEPAMPVFDVQTMAAALDTVNGFLLFWFAAALAGSLGLLGLLLAVVGVYGVISYSAAQRTHEIGIRLALGAQPSHVLKMILSQGLGIVGIGVIAGVLAAAAMARLVENLLMGVPPLDPLTYVTASVVLVLVSLLACYLPARRAMRVDPMVALRYE
ncbi:MAG TPA: ABC transporter permease [Candidatus Acidoferrales bacterium]|nr:ABC transporter permease [Candidatus Acidoferrales bacterium]